MLKRQAGKMPTYRAILERYNVIYPQLAQCSRRDDAASTPGTMEHNQFMLASQVLSMPGDIKTGQRNTPGYACFGMLSWRTHIANGDIPSFLDQLMQCQGFDHGHCVISIHHFAESLAGHVISRRHRTTCVFPTLQPSIQHPDATVAHTGQGLGRRD